MIVSLILSYKNAFLEIFLGIYRYFSPHLTTAEASSNVSYPKGGIGKDESRSSNASDLMDSKSSFKSTSLKPEAANCESVILT